MAKAIGGLPKNPPLGKAIKSSITRSIQVGSRMVCADNTGAKELEVVAVKGYGGVKRRVPRAGVGDQVIVSVKKGKPEIRKQILHAVIVRQKQYYTRPNGSKIKFHDNAAVIISEEGMPRGTEIKGAIAKEAAERWIKIGGLSSIVI